MTWFNILIYKSAKGSIKIEIDSVFNQKENKQAIYHIGNVSEVADAQVTLDVCNHLGRILYHGGRVVCHVTDEIFQASKQFWQSLHLASVEVGGM